MGPGSACFRDWKRDMEGILKHFQDGKSDDLILIIRVGHGLLPIEVLNMRLIHHTEIKDISLVSHREKRQ